MDNPEQATAECIRSKYFSEPSAAWRSDTQERAELHTAWGEHVKGYNWNWVAHLTPRFPDYSADRLQREFVQGFIRRLSWRARGSVPWFAATERGAGGVMHIHALLAAKHVSIEGVGACWKAGISDVKVYDDAGDMSFYITKTLALPNVSYERWNSSRTMPVRHAH
jgi:hypothetical protein